VPAVFATELGLMTVIGEETDTEIVEVLTTSLLVQAAAPCCRRGRVDRRASPVRGRSGKSFLVSYAQRIGERLTRPPPAGVGGH